RGRPGDPPAPQRAGGGLRRRPPVRRGFSTPGGLAAWNLVSEGGEIAGAGVCRCHLVAASCQARGWKLRADAHIVGGGDLLLEPLRRGLPIELFSQRDDLVVHGDRVTEANDRGAILLDPPQQVGGERLPLGA